MTRMLPIVALLAFAVPPADGAAAVAHHRSLPYEAQQRTVYLSLSDVEDQELLANVIKVVVPSLSHKPHLPSHLPYRLDGTNLMVLDLDALGWQGHYQQVIVQHYPLRPDLTKYGKYPLAISGLWFVAQVTDPVETGDALYQLTYSGKVPRSLADFQSFWRASNERELFLGFVEGNSGVSVVKRRTLENRASGARGYFWLTKDTNELNAKTDPLEQLVPGSVVFQASEAIAGFQKYGWGKSGAAQAYLLTDSRGNVQAKAPADAVVDHQQTRGVEIRNWISCIACHPKGITPPTVNEYAEYIKAGAEIKTYDKATQEQIEQYLEGALGKEIARNQEDYATFVEMCCGLKPEEFAAAFVKMVKAYDADVTLEQAARERGCEPNDLSLALGWATEYGEKLSARVAQLAHGNPMPRERYEDEAYTLDVYLRNWRNAK